jgi:hypothetical protein
VAPGLPTRPRRLERITHTKLRAILLPEAGATFTGL